jgi:polar amino acid transport system substrate-binding protein
MEKEMDKKRFVQGLAAFALIVAAFCAQHAAAAEIPGLATPGKLVVGLDDTFAPMGFRDPAGELVGFDIDLGRAVGDELGVEIVFQPIDWSAKEMELASKNIDCIWNGMSRTPDREVTLTLSQDYLNNRLAIMTANDIDITALSQLANYEIGTQAGSSALEAVKKSAVYPALQDKLHEYATYDECILDMQAGRIQAMVVDEVLGNYKNNNLDSAFSFSKVDFGNDYYVIGFRRDADNAANDELCAAVEAAIKKIAASGEGETISKKWFGTNLLLDMK